MTTLKPGDRVRYGHAPWLLTVRAVRDNCDDGPDCPLGGGQVFRYDDGNDPEDWLHASQATKVGAR